MLCLFFPVPGIWKNTLESDKDLNGCQGWGGKKKTTKQLYILESAVWGWPYFEHWIASLALHSLCSPVSPEQLDFIGSLEKPYCQYGSQGGTYQLFQHPQQHQCSQFHRLPSHPPSNVSSIHLTSMTTTESSADFLDLPGSSGRVTYGPAGATQGYVQNHVGEQPVLQWQNGNSGKFLKSWLLTPQE